MNKEEIKVGVRVRDKWFKEWGIGTIKEVKKTRVYIWFSKAGWITFDYQHAKMFLFDIKTK